MRSAVVYTAEDDKQYTEQDIKKLINQYLDNEHSNATDEERQDITEQAYKLIMKNQHWWPYITLLTKMKFKEK
jgi:uncharacterized protein YpuA (DUF1002 family)